MSDLSEIIAANECDDPTDTAAAVMDAIMLPAKFRDLLAGLIRDECRRLARNATRIAEASSHDETGQRSRAAHVRAARDSWLDRRFYTGERYVTWGDATINDHEHRVAYLGSLRTGIDATIERHREAITACAAAGVECLNDLPAAVAA